MPRKTKTRVWNNFELRNYDAAIGRCLTTDPYGQYHSPYVGMGNNPVSGFDVDGGWSGGPKPGGPIAYFVKLNEVVVNGIRSTKNYFNYLTWSQAWDDFHSGAPGHQYSRYVMADIQRGDYVSATAGIANATADIFTLGLSFTTKPAQLIVTESLVSTKQITSKEAQEVAREMRITSGAELREIGDQATKTIRNSHLAGDVHPKTGVPFDKTEFPNFSNNLYKDGVNDVIIKPTGNRVADYAAANKAAGYSSTAKGYTWHHH